MIGTVEAHLAKSCKDASSHGHLRAPRGGRRTTTPRAPLLCQLHPFTFSECNGVRNWVGWSSLCRLLVDGRFLKSIHTPAMIHTVITSSRAPSETTNTA